MKGALIFAAVGEIATGLALLILPSLVGRLLLGEELTGIAIPVETCNAKVACKSTPPAGHRKTSSNQRDQAQAHSQSKACRKKTGILCSVPHQTPQQQNSRRVMHIELTIKN